MTDAATVMERCETLDRISEEAGLLVRPYGSASLRKAHETVAGWMKAVGMSVRTDAVGNVIGRYEGSGERTLILGSHLDTVRDAGKYDGTLGVLVALACVERLHASNESPPFDVELVVFADEEGLRYGTTYLGSEVFTGNFDPALLKVEDADGVSLAAAVRPFGGDPDGISGDFRESEDLIGYCEVHIEQGPVLEKLDAPVGVVSAIVGQTRARVEFVGQAGHAGTVPMDGRRDALCAAAEFVLAVETVAGSEAGAVATVGEVSVHPSASNVIPGEASLTLDLRHADDATRERLRDRLYEEALQIATARKCELRWRINAESCGQLTDPSLNDRLGQAISDLGHPVHQLPSGAGHDAAALARITPAVMLFVRCKDGISHNPEESVEEADVAVALDVMTSFISLLAKEAR